MTFDLPNNWNNLVSKIRIKMVNILCNVTAISFLIYVQKHGF